MHELVKLLPAEVPGIRSASGHLVCAIVGVGRQRSLGFNFTPRW